MSYDDLGLTEPTKSTSHTGLIVLIIVIIVIIIIIILLVVFLRSDVKKDLTLENVTFTTTGSNSIEATWTNEGDDKDVVVLYAVPANESMKFDSSGNPQGTYASSGQPNPSESGKASTTTSVTNKTVSITSGLKSGVNYIATLVVTNSRFPDVHNHYTSQTLLVTETNVVPTIFSISNVGQNGNITYTPGVKPTIVGYELGKVSTNNIRFHHDPDGVICVVNSVTSKFTNTSKCPDNSYILYSNDDKKLDIVQMTVKDIINPLLTSSNYLWDYKGKKWCLKNSPSECMVYDAESGSKTDVPTIQDISISSTVDGDQWKNMPVKTTVT